MAAGTVLRAAPTEVLLPERLRPMVAQSAPGPLDSPDMAYEVKWDGMRALCGFEAERFQLRARSGIDATARFPELESIRDAIDLPGAVVDGEIVRLENGRPSFWALLRRIEASNPRIIASLAEAEPCTFMVFDLLRAGTEWLCDLPWHERRAQLEQAFRTAPGVLLSPVWEDGRALWEAAQQLQLEGVMAKRRSSKYLAGKRSGSWLKIKTVATVDVVVGGWTEGNGARGGLLGALLVGVPTGERLEYLGHVGTGFSNTALQEAYDRVRLLDVQRSPFLTPPRPNAPVHWTRPEAVCEIRHQGFSADGHFRAPVFVRWRPDKTPEECRHPQSASAA